MASYSTCMKCNGTEFETDEIRATGSGFSRYFDVQNKCFVAVSCKRCGYTEFYKKNTGGAGDILDYFMG